MWILLLSALIDQATGLKTQMQLEPIPEDGDLYMQGASDVAVAPGGAIYIVDSISRRVFVWNADGSYQSHFGEAGQGPGEFSFRGPGKTGHIAITERYVYVLDRGTAKIHQFDREHHFVASFFPDVARGMLTRFEVIDDNRFLMHNSSWDSDQPYRRLAVYSPNGELLETIAQIPDVTWRDGADNKVILIPYAVSMTEAYNELTGELVRGAGQRPVLEVGKVMSNTTRKVEVALPRLDVEKADKDEYNAQPWFANSQMFLVDFPDKKPFFNRIIPLTDGGFLVFLLSPYYGDMTGLVVDENGGTRHRVAYRLGENGRIFGSRGQVIAVVTDADGDFAVRLLIPG